MDLGILTMAIKKKKWIIILTMMLVIGTILYKYRNDFKINAVKISSLEKAQKSKNTNSLSKNKVVITDIHMGIGNELSVGMELACPYTSNKQYSQLWKYGYRIKSDFLLQVGSRQMNTWVKEKNYRAIKAAFLNIVNRYVDDPVTTVYLSKFFIE